MVCIIFSFLLFPFAFTLSFRFALLTMKTQDGHLLATLDGHRNAVCRMVQVKGLVWSCSMDCAVIAWDIQVRRRRRKRGGEREGEREGEGERERERERERGERENWFLTPRSYRS
jgi:hypothetical protein